MVLFTETIVARTREGGAIFAIAITYPVKDALGIVIGPGKLLHLA
jgi:hypothetical protein